MAKFNVLEILQFDICAYACIGASLHANMYMYMCVLGHRSGHAVMLVIMIMIDITSDFKSRGDAQRARVRGFGCSVSFFKMGKLGLHANGRNGQAWLKLRRALPTCLRAYRHAGTRQW